MGFYAWRSGIGRSFWGYCFLESVCPEEMTMQQDPASCMDDAPLFFDHGDRNLDWGKKDY